MPTKETIIEHARYLKSHCWALDPDPDNGEVWTGKGYGASFELIKDDGSIFGKDITCLTLSLRGKIAGKDRLMKEFTDALGKPTIVMPARRFRNPQLLSWNISATTENVPQY